jgi:hypothetical protein
MATAIQKLNGEANRSEIVKLRLAGHRLEDIAEKLGMTEAGVRYHQEAWLASQKPSSEQTEELRQMQAAKIDSLAARLEPRLDSDDYLAVTDRLVKLMDRKARLMGLDLQQGVSFTLVTREALAGALWDADAGVVEGTATEVTDADA